MSVLRLGRAEYAEDRLLVMAVVNRTTDSFHAGARSLTESAALDRVARAVEEGADLVDLGGVRAGPGAEVDVAEELRRTVGLVERVRTAYPELVVSVDTWRAEVGRAVCAAGADVLNDAWGGHDPELLEVAAAYDAGYVCTHTNGATPRTPPHRVSYDDVVASAVGATTALAERAVAAGVRRESVLVDPAHDFEKTTWHSLEVTRRIGELVATGWPVLVALSRKDFVGETLDLPTDQRLVGTLAATAVCAWQGARVFRAHDVAATRQTLDMAAAIRGDLAPARAVRALA